MQHQVLIVESNPNLARILTKQVLQAGLVPIFADTLYAAQNRFNDTLPESILCALVGYTHPDADCAEAIAFTTKVAIPTIAISAHMDNDIRNHVMHYDIVDYLGLDNAETVNYLYRLVLRLNKNKQIGVMVVSNSNRTRTETKSWLQRHGFMLFDASSPADAKQLLFNHVEIKMVMIDAALAKGKSAWLVAELRKVYTKEELVIVGMSATKADFTPAQFIKCGATDFFRLPFDHEEFLCRVMQMLEAIENLAVIRKSANTDFLTGLPNRRHFFYSVNKRHPNHINNQALALVDLDHFKQINDTWGHDAGDTVLQYVARLLATEYEDADIARFGGEEFCIYFHHVSAQDVITRIDSLLKQIEKLNIQFAKQTLRVTASIGLTISQNSNVEAMLSKADALLYQAKGNGRNQVRHDV